MKKLALVILSLLSFLPFHAQVNFPSEIKGNWLKASDSIEWYCSFQPGFAVLDKRFWNYSDIKRNAKSYEITISDGEHNKHIIIAMIDSSTLSVKENGSEILCTNRKAHKPDFHHYDDTAFTNLKLTDDTATIEGFIENYDTSVFSSQGAIYYYSAFTSVNEENYTTRFKIYPDGRFLVKFRMFNPQQVWLSIEGSTQTRIFACPGKTEFICFNEKLSDLTKNPELWQKFDDWDVNHFMGQYGLLSEELILLDPLINSFENTILESGMDYKLSQMEYQRWRKGSYLLQTKSIDSLINIFDNSKKAKQVIHSKMELLYIDDLYNLQFIKSPLSASYFSEMPSHLQAGNDIIVSDVCFNYINALNNLYGSQPVKGCIDMDGKPENKTSCLNKMLDDFKGDLTGQLLCTYNLMLYQDYRMLDAEMIAWIQDNVTEPVLKKVLLESHASQEELLLKYADFTPDTHFLDSIPETKSADDLFNQIISKFEGKIIYIDFWADWCSPCRAEFPNADILKKEYEDEGLVFLYLGVSCEQDDWKNMIKLKQISGYHYWLNKEQSKQLLDKFGIKGIPHFILVDKNGDIADEEAPLPSSKTLIREKLNLLLSL